MPGQGATHGDIGPGHEGWADGQFAADRDFPGRRRWGFRVNLPNKSNLLQAYQIVLYNRALHPDQFHLKARRVVRHNGYELEVWLMPGRHLLRFEHVSMCAAELLWDQDGAVPATGIVGTYLCAGEREVEHTFAQHRVQYIASMTSEALSESLYVATYDEMLDHARAQGALAYRWEDDAGKCLSVVDVQRYAREVHAQSYHLVAAAGLVLRTQTIFELQG